MAREDFKVDSSGELLNLMKNVEGNTEKVINDIFWNEAGPLINDEIVSLLPVSNRTWRGKKKSAKYAQPFNQENKNLSVTVKTKFDYHYLYFPDDGTNTKGHAGEQYFMYEGALNKRSSIIERCIAEITEKFNL